jgi:hypothetical protein
MLIKTTITADADDFFNFSDPSPRPAPGNGNITVRNNSGKHLGTSVGTLGPHGNLEPFIFFHNVA